MAGINVGSVSVEVIPSTDRFVPTLRAQILAPVDQMARDIGQRITRQISDAIGRGVSDGARAAQGNSARAGDSTGGAFADAFKSRVAAALRDLPNPRVGLDATELDAELADIRTRMEALRDVRVGVDLSAEEALAELESLRFRLDELGARSPNIDVQVDAARASAELSAVQAEVEALDGRTAHVNVDIGTSGLPGFGFGAGGLLGAGLGLGPGLIPVGAAGIAGGAGLTTSLLAGAGGLGALALGVAGVSDAVKLLGQQQDAAAQDAAKLATSSASSAAAQAAAANRVTSAQASLANARANAADAAVTAAERVVNAERTLTAANQQAAAAQKALNDAREQAVRDLEDSANRQADAQLSAKQAALDVVQAEQALRTLGAGGAPVTELQRQQAILAVAEAQQRQKEAELDATRASADNTKAQKAGIDGDRNVVSAQQAVVNALNAQTQAQQSLADAQRAQATQARQSAYAISQAEQQVTNAMLAMQTAAQDGGTATSTAMAKVQAQLAKVSPATLALAKLWEDRLLPVFNNLKDAAAAGLLPGIEAGVKALTPLIKPFTDFIGGLAKVMGDLFAEGSKALTSPFWQQFFTYVSATAGPTLKIMGEVLGDLAKGFGGLLEAFAPVTRQLGDGILHLAQRFADWASTLDRNPAFQHFLAYIQENGPAVVQMIGDLGKLFGALIAAMAPLGAALVPVISGVAKFLASLPPPVLAGIAAGIATIIGGPTTGLLFLGMAFALAWQKSETFRDTIKGVFKVVGDSALNVGIILAHALLDPIKSVLEIVQYIPGPWQSMAKRAVGDINNVYDALDRAKRKLDELTNPKPVTVTYQFKSTISGLYPAGFIGPVPAGGTYGPDGTYYAPTFIGPVPTAVAPGKILKRALGGIIPGYQPGVDSVLAMLSPGEAVLRPEVTRAIGADTINAWNAAATRFADGGIVYRGESGAAGMDNAAMSGASGGHVRGGLTVEQLIVQSAPGEPAATSVPRGLRNLALSLGL